MKDRCDEIPVACSLTTVELRDREATLLAQFRSAVIETEELQEGYAFRLSGDGEWIGLIAELMVAERECCPFLSFELAVLPNKGPVIVRVTGPAGTKEFLRTLLCKSDESAWRILEQAPDDTVRRRHDATDLDARVRTAISARSRLSCRCAAS